jgi:hypothetical protein
MPAWTDPVLEKIVDIGQLYFQSITQTDEMKRLRVGALLNELVKNFDSNLKSEEIEMGRGNQKMYLFSGHDHTLTGILDVLGLQDKMKPRPIFASAIFLELHESSMGPGGPPEIRVRLTNEN